MTLSVTLVHHPDGVPATHWRRLRDAAPGAHGHELDLQISGAHSPSGAELAGALHRWMAEVADGPGPSSPQLSVAGSDLERIPSGSAQIHPGMVVVLLPRRSSPPTGEGPESGLRLIVERGPDSGQVHLLRRGTHTVGRAAERIRIADPTLRRRDLSICVGSRSVRVRRPEAKAPRRRPTTETWAAGSPLTIGDTTLGLLNTPAPLPTTGAWPPGSESVSEKPPEGRHRMMLIMALVPMVIGIVLVTVTGMWFFLLFSAVSAMVAAATLVDALRRRRRFRRAVRRAAHRWADRAERSMATPGQLASAVGRVGGRPASLGAGAVGRDGQKRQYRVLGCGRARQVPDLELPSGVDQPEDTTVEAPLIVETVAGHVTQITGPLRGLRRTARWLLVQLLIRQTGGRGPVVLDGGARSLQSDLAPNLGDLVHGDSEADTDDLVRSSVTPVLLCVADDLQDHDGEMTPAGHRIARRRRQGWHILVLRPEGHTGDGLPWDVQVDLVSGTRTSRDDLGREVGTAEQAEFDGMSDRTASHLLRRALPSCTGLEGAAGIPDHATEPLPPQLMSASSVAGLTTVLGVSADGRENLDLVMDGPHILIAGTSGSGKSELLKSLMLGWAARYGPDELNFMLFDFKGGSTFRQIDSLEHSLGLVTDLSQAQAERTLEGIRSELTRREKLFLEVDAGDYAEFRRLRPDTALPRILVVIDEFRIFTHELPDTMDELMRLATLGRSLGLHLVLSTQRPQGVVTADIRANIGAVIALRLRGTDESQDLVGGPRAGEISRHRPGRGVISRPGDQSVEFQSVLPVPQETVLKVAPTRTEATPTTPHADPGRDSQVVLEVLTQEVSARGLRRRHTPVLQPLPDKLVLAPDHRTEARIGLVDRPSSQSQDELIFDPATDTSLGLIGEGASGGRQALRAAAHQLLEGLRPVHLYLLDGDGSLDRFADHRRVGAYLTDQDGAEFDHLLLRLKDELTRRRSSPGPHTPLVLLMSGHSQWHAMAQSFGASGMDHLLGTLIAEGQPAGITMVISGGRELASGKLGARLTRRIYLPYGVSQDSRFLWPKMREVDPLPGRGVLHAPDEAPPGSEIQLVQEIDSTSPAPPREDEHRPDIIVRPLPEVFTDDTREAVDEAGPIRVGVREFSLDPAALDLHRVTLILGAPGTGRTNALRVIASQRSAALWVEPQTPIPTHLDAAPDLVLVDDADRCTPTHHRLVEQCLDAGAAVVAAAAPSTAIWGQIPWSHHARSSGEHMLLSPTRRGQSDVFATSVPLLDRPIPGRAVHLKATGPEMIHWPRHTDS